MAKALKIIGTVVAVVAVVASAFVTFGGSLGLGTTIFGVSAGTIATYAGVAALAVGLAQYAIGPPKFSQSGNPLSFQTNPQSGLPYPIGRTRMSGLRIHADTYDAPSFKSESKDDILSFAVLLGAGGPMESIESFTADNEVVTFAGDGNAVGNFHDWMAQKVSLGTAGVAALALTFGGFGFPGWSSAHQLSGMSHALWDLRYDSKGDHFGAGPPEPAWIGKWAKVYDPRKDSTYPGGSGSHRALNESTYEWSRNPALHALTWCIGRWQNGKKVLGIGAPVANIRVADFVEAANVADANNWGCGGVNYTTDSKWDVLKAILQAGGAEPTQTGAMIGCRVNTPRVSIATITGADLLDKLSMPTTRSRRDRFNTAIPRYRSEDHDWEVISGTPVAVTAYITEDGAPRTKEIDLTMVQAEIGQDYDGNAQAGQLVAYEIVNSREAGPWQLTVGPAFIGVKTGDCITLDVPDEDVAAQPVIVRKRTIDPATMKITFEVDTETDAKHDFALGKTTTPPPSYTPTPPNLTPPTPDSALWSLSADITADGVPSLVIAGVCEFPGADLVLLEYRKVGDPDWISLGNIEASGPVNRFVTAVDGAATYEARVAYRAGNRIGDWLVLTSVTAPAMAIGDPSALTTDQPVIYIELPSTAGGADLPNSYDNASGQLRVLLNGTDITSDPAITFEPITFPDTWGNGTMTYTLNTAANTPVAGKPKGWFNLTELVGGSGNQVWDAVYGTRRTRVQVVVTRANAPIGTLDVDPVSATFHLDALGNPVDPTETVRLTLTRTGMAGTTTAWSMQFFNSSTTSYSTLDPADYLTDISDTGVTVSVSTAAPLFSDPGTIQVLATQIDLGHGYHAMASIGADKPLGPMVVVPTSGGVWLPSNANGDDIATTYADAGTQFSFMVGDVDITADVTLTAASDSGNISATINTAADTPVAGKPKGWAQVTALTDREDGQAIWTATWGTSSVAVLLVARRQYAPRGSTDPVISGDSFVWKADGTGPVTSTQVLTATVVRNGLTGGTVTWTDAHAYNTHTGVSTPVSISSVTNTTTGDTVQVTAAQYATALGANWQIGSLVINSVLTIDGVDYPNSFIFVATKLATDGTSAKTVDVTTNRDAFTFDGAANLSPSTQSAVVTANPQNFVGGNVVWSYSDNLGTSSATLAALVTATSINVRTVPSTVFTGTLSRSWIQVTATGQGAESSLSDTVTIVRLNDGAATLTVQLNNEAHTVPTDSAGASGDFSGAFGQVKVYYGATDVTASATLSEVSETGCTGDINTATNTPVSGQAKGYYRVTAMSTDTADYKVRATYNPGSGTLTVDRDFTLAKSKAGTAGASAKALDVTSDRQAFTFDGASNLNPGTQSAVVTANPQNFVGGAVVWSYTDNLGTASATLAGLVTATSANVRTVPSTVFTGTLTRTWLKVTATGQGAESGLSDSVTITRLNDGSGVLTVIASNEAQTITTANDGTGGDFSGAVGQLKVFYGTTDVTATTTISEVSETNCTGDVNTATNTPFTGAKGAYRVTAMTADTATYKMRAVYNPGSGNITVDRDFTLSRSKTGAAGADAKLVTIDANRTRITFNAYNEIFPASQDTTLTATLVNVTGGTFAWTIFDQAGNNKSTTYLSGTTGSSTTITAANVRDAAGSTAGVRIVVTHSTGLTDSWKISVDATQSGAGTLWSDATFNQSYAAFATSIPPVNWSIETNGAALGLAFANFLKAGFSTVDSTWQKAVNVPCRPSSKLFVRFKGGTANGSVTTNGHTAGLYFKFYKADKTTQTGSTQLVTTTTVLSAAWPSTVPPDVFAGTNSLGYLLTPTDAAYMEFGTYKLGDPSTLGVFIMEDIVIDWSEPGANSTETRLPYHKAPSEVQEVSVSSSGSIKGYPGTLNFYRMQGTADVSTTSAWSVTVTPVGAATVSIGAATGILTISSLTKQCLIEVSSSRDNFIVRSYVRFDFLFDIEAFGTGAYDSPGSSSAALLTSTSYGSTPAIGPLTVTSSAAGTLTFNMRINALPNAAGNGGAEMKAQYRTPPGSGSWTDVGGLCIASSIAYSADSPLKTASGVTVVIGSLSALASYEARFLARKNTGDTSASVVLVDGTRAGVSP